MSNYYPPVIVQANYSPLTAPNSFSSPPMSSSASSYAQTTSSGSNRTYISTSTTNSSSSTTAPSVPLSRNAIRPARVIGEHPYGQVEFVYTGRPQGGNPNGGPRQHLEGYTRVSKGNVTVHNSGGQSKGTVPIHLESELGNGPEHSGECRMKSRWSDNQGLCFCPPRPN